MPTPPRLASAPLAAANNIRHGFYGRLGGASSGIFASLNCSHYSGDQQAMVDANRRCVADDLGATALFTNHQVHGNRVRIMAADADPDEPFDGDGMVTGESGIALGVLAADCAPVLFADPQARVIGAAHAGWQGALLGVTDAVISKMTQLGAQPSRMLCAIGPAIQASSYQVGAEFVERFAADSPLPCAACFHQDKTGNHYFDLPRYLRLRIAAAGIASVDTVAADTCTDEARFFSYRRSCQRGETKYGRQVGAIVLA